MTRYSPANQSQVKTHVSLASLSFFRRLMTTTSKNCINFPYHLLSPSTLALFLIRHSKRLKVIKGKSKTFIDNISLLLIKQLVERDKNLSQFGSSQSSENNFVLVVLTQLMSCFQNQEFYDLKNLSSMWRSRTFWGFN